MPAYPCEHCYEKATQARILAMRGDGVVRRLQQEIQYQLKYAPSTIVDEVKNGVGQINTTTSAPITETAIKQLTGGDKKMNIVTYAKLNKNQRTLYKVGIVDTDGHLTDEGRNVLLDMLASDAATQTKLVDIAKEYKKDQKED